MFRVYWNKICIIFLDFFINFQPQIIDSLLALAKVLVKGLHLW